MPRSTGIHTNRLTVYLIKSRYKSPEDIVEPGTKSIPVGSTGRLIFEASHPQPPSWITNFFGDGLNERLGILTSSAKALFLVPVKTKSQTNYFGISFGQGRHLLKEGVVEERFGLKVVLNSVGLDSFRSIDKTTLGAVPKHSREQMSREVSPSEFGIDIEQDLVSSVTAKSTDPKLGKVITGRDAFHFSAPVNVTNIVDFLSYSLARSKTKTYRQNFDWIDQIAEVKNSVLEDALNAELVRRLASNEIEKIWMAVPEVVDWATVSGFRYTKPKRAELMEDLNLERFLQEDADGPISIDTLTGNHIYAISA